MNEDSNDADSAVLSFDQMADNLMKLNESLRTQPSKIQGKSTQIIPVYVFTAIFGLIFIIAPLFVRQGPNRSIIRVCIMLSTVCCWIFWTTTYIVQMNPLLGPRLSNHSLAWIGHKWGHDAAELTKKLAGSSKEGNDTII